MMRRMIISNLISVIAAVTNRVAHLMKMDHTWKIVNSQVLEDTQIVKVLNHLRSRVEFSNLHDRAHIHGEKLLNNVCELLYELTNKEKVNFLVKSSSFSESSVILSSLKLN